MKERIIAIITLCMLPLGCAVISEQGRMEEYTRNMTAYDTAMHLSDFNTACQVVDPSEMPREKCLQRYDNLKIISYEMLATKVAEDKRQVSQTIEVEYFFLDRNIVKKLQYEQSWRYSEDRKTWVLHTGPPLFE